jgi:hypothetical protein
MLNWIVYRKHDRYASEIREKCPSTQKGAYLLEMQYVRREIPQETVYHETGAENTRVPHPARFEETHENLFAKQRAQFICQFALGIARSQHKQYLMLGRKGECKAAGILGEMERYKCDPHCVLLNNISLKPINHGNAAVDA